MNYFTKLKLYKKRLTELKLDALQENK